MLDFLAVLSPFACLKVFNLTFFAITSIIIREFLQGKREDV